jgi:hypothetical protein
LLLLLLLLLPSFAQAQFLYVTNNGTITITGYTGPGGDVAIPDVIDGLPVTSIGDSAFYFQSSLTQITIPDSVTTIGDSAFIWCMSLTSVTIPNSVTNIGDHAYESCIHLTNATLGNGIATIGNSAFSRCTSLTSITIPNSVTNTGDYVFESCTSLTSVFIPASVTSIGRYTFSRCTSLASITNLNSVSTIGYWAFSSCTSLTNITISSSVTNIDQSAFYNCTSLPSITIPSSVTSIGFWAFDSCTSLNSITVDALNPVYSSVDGILFNKSQTVLIQYPAGKAAGAYTVPASVTVLGMSAFSFCTNLTNVVIHNSVTSIGQWTFSSCTSLSAITVDASNPVYSSVDGVLFDNDQTLLYHYPAGKAANAYTIPNSVTWIIQNAFHSCASLTRIIFPVSLTMIDNFAFFDTAQLTGLYFEGNRPNLRTPVFDGATNATVYYLPGTWGWGVAFGGRPTAEWQPKGLTSGPNFGMRTNHFGFDITWASDRVVLVEACTNLTQPVWSVVSTNTLTGGSSYFSDPAWTNHATRYYRLRSP